MAVVGENQMAIDSRQVKRRGWSAESTSVEGDAIPLGAGLQATRFESWIAHWGMPAVAGRQLPGVERSASSRESSHRTDLFCCGWKPALGVESSRDLPRLWCIYGPELGPQNRRHKSDTTSRPQLSIKDR